MIDLRTDTVTRPTSAMLQAMVAAPVGDEQKGEDPTTLALERRVAELLGHDEAVLVPSATMANQIALRVLTHPGEEIVAHATSHVFCNEMAGHAVHSALATTVIDSPDGRFDAAALRGAHSVGAIPHARTGVVCVENTHSNAGGRAWSVDQVDDVVTAARALGVATHLDGARLLNAAVAHGVPPAAYGARFDTVTLCLSKGLGCPFGALVVGSRSRMAQARRLKQLFGGAMRQSGIMAAAGLHALDHHVDRLADDHAAAVRLAEGLDAAGLPVDPGQVETNCVLIDVARLNLASDSAIAACRNRGVLVSRTATKGVLRAVTHLDVTVEQIDHAVTAIGQAIGPKALDGARDLVI